MPDPYKEVALEIIRIIDCDLWGEVKNNTEQFSYQLEQIGYLINEAYCSGWCDCEAENGLDGP